MTDFTLYLSSTNLVQLSNLVDVTTGLPVTTAVVTVTFKDAQGNVVTGASGITMPYDATSRSYRGTLPSTITWVAGATYTEIVTTTVGSIVRVFTRTGVAANG